MTSFADRLVPRLRRLGHPLCVGLDPHLSRIPPLFRRGAMTSGDPETAMAVEAFLGAVLDRVAERVAVVKPQAAFFEALGWPGMKALAGVVRRAREHGLLVVLDAKRGDIGSTAAAYAAAHLGADAPFPADALTVNPYLGMDSLDPFVDRARDIDAGLFVLLQTSNPGGRDFQDAELAEGGRLVDRVAGRLAESADDLVGKETGWSSLGVVVGATRPGEADRLRDALPTALFLVPGYGAQGGTASGAVRGFVPGPGGVLEGGIVNSSRGILFPEGADTDDASRWERAIDGAVDRATGELGDAVGGG